MGAAACAIAAVVIGSPRAARADAASDAARLFQEADAAASKRDWATCIAKAELAWTTFQHAQIRGLQGKCEVEAGKYRDGAVHISFYEKSSTSGVEPDFLEALKKAKEHVEELTITNAKPGAVVSVDGVEIGPAPVTLFLDPGKHVIDVKAGTETVKKEIDAVAGTKVTVDVPFPLVIPGGGGGKSAPLLVVGSALGVAGVAVGAALLGVGAAAASERDDALAELDGQNRCASGTPYTAECAQIQSDNDTYKTLTIAGVVSLGVGAAVGVATLIYGVVPSSKPEASLSWTVLPVVTREFHGASLSGVF